MRRRVPSARLERQDGMTLVELMVAMSIMAIAVAAIFGVLTSVQRGVEKQTDIVERQARAVRVTQSLDREVRSAVAMTTSNSGQTLSMLTRTNLDLRNPAKNGKLICSQFKIDGVSPNGVLKKRFWVEPAAGVPAKPWTIVATGVKTTSGAFAIDPNIDYGGSVLQVSITLDGAGSAVDQPISQAIKGDNVLPSNVNTCDGVAPHFAWPL